MAEQSQDFLYSAEQANHHACIVAHPCFHQFAYTQTRVFLCPNWSLEPRKFQFVALQTELRITQIDFFIGLTKFYRAYDKFLSLC